MSCVIVTSAIRSLFPQGGAERLHLRFLLTLRLLYLTVLVLGALLSSFLEESLYVQYE